MFWDPSLLVKHNNLSNSEVVIYLSWLGNLFSTSLIFVSKTVVVSKPLVFGILFYSDFCVQNSCSH